MTQDEQFADGVRATGTGHSQGAVAEPDAGLLNLDDGSEFIEEDDEEYPNERGGRDVRMRASLFTTLLTLGGLLILALAAGNVYQFLHGRSSTTVATVNGARITQADFVRAAGSSDSALQSLIDQELIRQEARKQKLSIPDSEVNAELSTIKQQLGSQAEFNAALQKANLTEPQLREQIRMQKLAQTMGAKGVSVSDDEAQNFYNTNKAQFGSQTFDQSKDQIKTQILQSKQNESIQTWIAGLRQKARISVHIPT